MHDLGTYMWKICAQKLQYNNKKKEKYNCKYMIKTYIRPKNLQDNNNIKMIVFHSDEIGFLFITIQR